jgi:hypothetical protein
MKIIIVKKVPQFKKAPVSLVEFSHLRQVPGTSIYRNNMFYRMIDLLQTH